MSTMSGNPFVGEPDGNGVVDAVVFSADGSPMQTTEILLDQLKDATLALAYEQQTANFIAWMDLGMNSHTNGVKLDDEVREAIMYRLGLGGDDS